MAGSRSFGVAATSPEASPSRSRCASDQAGTSASDRIAAAARTRSSSAGERRRAGRRAGSERTSALRFAVLENLLDRPPEQGGELEGERQRRIVFARLDRVHGLARDAEPAAKLRLAPV